MIKQKIKLISLISLTFIYRKPVSLALDKVTNSLAEDWCYNLVLGRQFNYQKLSCLSY